MHLKLKDILKYINIYQPLKLASNNGEIFYPSYAELYQFQEDEVLNISAENEILKITIRMVD